MQIQPRIDTNGYVTSHIFAEASSVTQYVNTGGQSVPQVSLRQVTTEATVKDGQPYILGGLLLDEEIDSLSKIPGIGDLPLIGGFFRVRHTTTQRTNLYIIITPHIIHQIGTSDEAVPKLPPMEVPGPMPSYPPASPNP
jgi:general secretion pathway protein D